MNSEQAEILALKALAWLASHDDHLQSFCDLSGLSGADLIEQAGNPETLAGVMDFILSDEPVLLDFCEDRNISPDIPAQARIHLPGGALPHWT